MLFVIFEKATKTKAQLQQQISGMQIFRTLKLWKHFVFVGLFRFVRLVFCLRCPRRQPTSVRLVGNNAFVPPQTHNCSRVKKNVQQNKRKKAKKSREGEA